MSDRYVDRYMVACLVEIVVTILDRDEDKDRRRAIVEILEEEMVGLARLRVLDAVDTCYIQGRIDRLQAIWFYNVIAPPVRRASDFPQLGMGVPK